MSEFFPGVPKIVFEGKDSQNPLAFRFYNADELNCGQTYARALEVCDVLLAYHGSRRCRYVWQWYGAQAVRLDRPNGKRQ